ncbi:transmembrane protein 94-like protein l(2)k05819 isoform X2 [Leptinotarsa decemlineata]|uniref:transmembrane protein 94-like protein l(2)k05819 isoform X2 n=1 Tax=Leptinotarsa decemlineata TaxID=7539 RepID=UPI003D307D91
MEIKNDEGLKTGEALNILYVEISTLLHQYETSQHWRKSKSWVRDALHFKSQRTTVNIISIIFGVWTAISLLIGYLLEGDNVAGYEAIPILFLILMNVTLELYDNKLRHNEIPNRIRSFLEKLKKERNNIKWTSENYPDLYSPISPCITLHWTYRDGQLVNLPWALLVKDDIVLMRPGQASPGYCECLDKHSEIPILHAKEIYAPLLQNANEIFSAPKSRKPLEPKKYRLLETPYLNNLKIFLEQALDRPVTLLNHQRHLVTIKIVEQVMLPFTFISVLFVNLFRYFYFHKYFGRYLVSNTLFIVPCNVVLPLLPMIFPLFWNLVNYFGIARFKAIFDGTIALGMQRSQLEEDADNITEYQNEIKINRNEVYSNFMKIIKGKPEILTRSTNILHVLGSVSALGCIDKKGILSWPNPTAEKVFFLYNQSNESLSSSLDNVNDLSTDIDPVCPNILPESARSAVTEVLDLTHKHNEPFKLYFDDQDWSKYLSSLKPLGLAILLNTCNVDTQKHYTSFCSHITCEAMYNENLVPVTNRRCLCELAKEIGFVDQAQKIFSLEEQLSAFRHLQTEMVRKDNKFVRSLQLSTKLKFPFPHMFAVVVKELASGNMQLLSEGTADIILDSCVEYWDGKDLIPLTNSDRKRIKDFYQRSSLTAYCTAFAYRPLTKSIDSKMSEVYLELPSDSRSLYHNHRSPTPAHWDCKSVLEPKIKSCSQFYSTDSLLYNNYPSGNVSDAESCFQMQCSQIFIGMVTMQYQALTDMVQMIEQLERACIRFVHFSKENELRSRVFSEKMGLESGWNCHISLLSEKNSNLESSRTMSFSAPSAINMEYSVVKFDTEVEKFNIGKKQSDRSVGNDSTSEDSIPLNADSTTHEWQSLSNLTESTEQSAPINFDMSNRGFKIILYSRQWKSELVKLFFSDEDIKKFIKISKDHSLTINPTKSTAIIFGSDKDRQRAIDNISLQVDDKLVIFSDSIKILGLIIDHNFKFIKHAKLPRGIDKIRPHIEHIDNVPLLVSLFTDCNPDVTRQMLNIMQEYKEIVCIMGSSENCDNAGIFMTADASISIQPLYPQVCQKREVFQKPVDCLGPTDLSYEMNSIPCALSLKRDEPFPLYRLIMEARHFVAAIWNSGQFWLCCCVALSLMQVLSIVIMLPGLLTTGQVLWFSCIVIPTISITLMFRPLDPDIMKKPQGKIQAVPHWDVAVFILWCYGSKFLTTLVVVLVSYVSILTSHCDQICVVLGNCTCAFYYNPVILTESVSMGGWDENEWTLLISRLIISFLILLHFVVISMGFIHRNHLVFQRSPHKNLYWLTTVFILILVQSIYTMVVYNSVRATQEDFKEFDIPLWVILFAAVSPLAVCIVNELVKKHEIRVNERFLKRARLDFGTKLGMNSPF